MTRDIGVDANINKIRLKEQSSVATPPSTYGYLYIKSGGIYFKGSGGTEIGPLGSGGATSDPYILIRDEKASGTDGGTFTSGSYQTRDLNTEVSDTGNHVSLASNQMTLDAGTYRCRIACPAFHVSVNKAVLYNVSDSAVVLIGTSAYSDLTSNYANSYSFVVGRFTLASSKILEVRHRCNTTRATDGFGTGCGFGDTEVFTVVEMWKEQ